MNVFVLLDILLLILIALFIPIGFWRGAYREVLVTLGILFGATLGEWWAGAWGQDLAALTRLRDSGGAFMVAVMFLIGSTFLLGYGAGAALPVPRPGMISRLFGGLIAGANGALVLSFALRDIRFYLLPESDSGFLDRAVVADFLSVGIGWLLLGALVVFLPIVLGLALFGQGTTVADFGDADEEYQSGFTPTPRTHPPRAPVSTPDDQSTAIYKTEPQPEPGGHSAAEETRPVRSLHSLRSAPQSSGGWYRRDGDEDQVTVAGRGTEFSAQETLHMQPDTSETVADGKCPGCRADVSDAEVYCPRCGRVL